MAIEFGSPEAAAILAVNKTLEGGIARLESDLAQLENDLYSVPTQNMEDRIRQEIRQINATIERLRRGSP
jgi:septal ring factor EnvC (AmiA/AmiB activator)